MTITANNTKKFVNIKNNNGSFLALLVQPYAETETYHTEQVLNSKSFKSEKSAIKWANKELA